MRASVPFTQHWGPSCSACGPGLPRADLGAKTGFYIFKRLREKLKEEQPLCLMEST